MRRVLVANRAEIASRVFRTCRRLGISTVAVFSDADEALPFVAEADLAVRLPGNAPAETYLRGDLIIDAAKRAGADAVHPGYGFLSENADFARAVIDAGLTWIGPTPESIEAMGSKVRAKEIMKAAGVPVLEAPSSPTEADLPLLVKASAGGGGRGMRVVRSRTELDAEIAAAQAEAAAAFGDGTIFVEPYVERGRHVEVQLVGTSVFGDRDCSLQRRHQKVVEEAPAPGLPDEVRAALHDAARQAAEAIDYRGAGTVEFLYDPDSQRFWFLEMNTRLQVEHPVTEEVFGIDLVELQLAAAGLVHLGLEARKLAPRPAVHAIEVRLYAEDPAADYAPQSGRLTRLEISGDVRVEAGYGSGNQVSTFYDAMIAKVIATAPTRAEAAGRLVAVLRGARIHGVRTNREQLVAILESPEFLAGRLTTGFLLGFEARSARTSTSAGGESDAAVAAAIALAEQGRARRTVQQGIPVAWRNVTSQPQRTEFTDGTVVEWYGGRDGYVAEGLTVVAACPERVVLERDGVRTAHDVSIDGDRVDVDSPHGHTALTRRPRFTDPATRLEPGSLVAPMPGTVVKVLAEAGRQVQAGDGVLVLEAMKMQHTVSAPADGVIAEIDVEPGAQVAAGQVLARVEER